MRRISYIVYRISQTPFIKKVGLLIFFLCTAHPVFAQDSTLDIDFNTITTSSDFDLSGLDSIGEILSKLTPILFTIAGIILFLFFFMAGFSYLTSSGDPKKTEAAKARITESLIGFVIIITAFWLVQIAAFIFNLEDVSTFFGS